jgi:hypothetical protein
LAAGFFAAPLRRTQLANLSAMPPGGDAFPSVARALFTRFGSLGSYRFDSLNALPGRRRFMIIVILKANASP